MTLPGARPVRAPRGTDLSAKSWQTEAPLRMLMNNLDPEVAERPDDLVVYGGTGRAARSWEAFDAIVATLQDLEEDETLLVQSGKPVGVLRTNPWAPRVLLANSHLVPDWATWPEFRRLEGEGLLMYGQMTAGSWIYIATQGILQGTYETFAAVARARFGGTLAGTITLTGGCGGMGGAQPLAVTLNGGVCLIADVDRSRLERRAAKPHPPAPADAPPDPAARAAAEEGSLVSLGIVPPRPASGSGYTPQAVDGGGAGPVPGTGALPVARFVEKPDRHRAEEFLASGRHLWNAGMFVVRASVLLDELAEQIPPLAAGARAVAAARDTASEQEVLERTWPTLLSVAIDHALAEPLADRGRVAVVPAHFDWDDVGDFAALARQLRTDAAGERARTVSGADGRALDVRVLGTGSVDAVGSRATVYGATHRHVALVGLDGISVVDTEDALLVLADDHAQDLSGLVGSLAERGLDRLR